MSPWNILWMVLGILIGIFFLWFGFAYIIHRSVFKKRWMPNPAVRYYTLDDYPALQAEEVSFSRKNVILRGFLYSYSHTDIQGVLIFSHGMWSSHRSYLQEMEFFARNGYVVLGFDNCGTDLSSGKNIHGLGESITSLDYAIRYVRSEKRFAGLPICIVGHSWGAFAAVCIAKWHPDLNKIVALSPFRKTSLAFGHLIPKVLVPLVCLIDSFFCGTKTWASAFRILKRTKIPTLIVHSQDDPMVLFQKNTAYLMNHLNRPQVRFEIVDGKRHNPDYCQDAIEYGKEIEQKYAHLSSEEKKVFQQQIDYHRLGKLDEEVMNSILAFLENN